MRTLNLAGFGLFAFAITAAGGGIWSALLIANLQGSPAVPWPVVVMTLLLWLIWAYLGGKGWPRSTSETRRQHLRANKRSGPIYRWALVAGVLSVIALAGLWIVFFQLVLAVWAFQNLAKMRRQGLASADVGSARLGFG